MIHEDLRIRKYVILGTVGVLTAFTVMLLINYADGDIVWMFYPGLAIGILFGGAMCWSLYKNWDPKTLSMKPTARNNSGGAIPWAWGPPLGVLVGNIIAQFLGNAARNLMMGVLLGWLYLFLSYTAIQVWRHRPKS